MKQDHQALFRTKYCPPVAAALCTQKKALKARVTLTFSLWPWNSVWFYWRLLRYVCVQNFIKLSAAVHELSTVH